MIDCGKEARNENEVIMLQCFSRENFKLGRQCFTRLKRNSPNKASNKISCFVRRNELSRLLIIEELLKQDETEA